MAIIKAINTSGKGLKRCINYVMRKGTLEDGQLLGIGCNPRTAYNEMMLTKELHNNTEGLQHLHLVMSLSPEESKGTTVKELLQIAEQALEGNSLFKGYQALIVAHQDKEHLHAHIVINTVNEDTGKKIHFFKHQLKEVKDIMTSVVLAHGLSVPIKGKANSIGGQGDIRRVVERTQYDHITKELFYRNGDSKVKSWEADIAYKVKTVVKECKSKEEYRARLEQEGITITRWKDSGDSEKDYITYCMSVEGKDKKVKNRRLEEVFHLDFSVRGLNDEFERNAQLNRDEQQPEGMAEESRARSTEGKGINDDVGAGTPEEPRRSAELNEQINCVAERLNRARSRASRNRSRARLFAINLRTKRLRASITKPKVKPKQKIRVRVKYRGY